MNQHCGRRVFNKIRGCLMTVAESAKGQGKGRARGDSAASRRLTDHAWARAVHTLALSAMVTQTTLAPLTAYAQVRSDAGAPGQHRPTVLTTGNGLPQVNITTPSAAGVSRNRLSQMDVDGRGVVVNNSRTHTPTQLGGWVQGNPWLATGEARVILMEVNSQNPSQINGFIEIAGQRSEIIVANPAGLNVNGGGFINASRATLTTGDVNLNDAGVSGYTVRGGTITIGNQGFDASLTDYTGILARAVAVRGPLAASELNIVTGANQIDARAQDAAPTSRSGAAPAFALDVSALGGMYAGKITLVTTEAGVGVRNAGGIQAGSGGLTLSANGDLVNAGDVSSKGTTRLSTAGRFDNSGQMHSAGALNIRSSSDFSNSGSVSSAQSAVVAATDIVNSGQISAANELSLNARGRLDNAGSLSAGTHLSLQGQQLSNAGTLNAGQQLSLSSAGRFDNAGQVVVQGSLSVQAPQGIGNTGRIESQNGITLNTAADIDNQGRVVADGALALTAGTSVTNSGVLMGDKGVAVSGAQTIDNRGQLYSGAQASLSATDRIDNRGDIVSDGDLRLESGQRIDNRSTGQIHAGANLQLLTGQAIVNQGQISAGNNTSLHARAADGRIDNAAGAVLGAGVTPTGAAPLGRGNLQLDAGGAGAIDLKGLTLAGQSISARAGTIDLQGQDLLSERIDLSAGAGHLLAQGSSLQAVDRLRLDATGQLRTDAAAIGASRLAVTAADWNLQGARVQQTGTGVADARVQVSGRIDASDATVSANAGDLSLSGGELQLARASLTHSGTGTLTLRSGGAQTVVADDALVSTGGSLSLGAAALQAHRGLISAQSDASVSVQGALDANDATVVANGALALSAARLGADRTHLVGVERGTTLNIAGPASLREGSVQSRGDVQVAARGLDITGGLISGQDVTLHTGGGALSNADGAVLALGALHIRSGAIDNRRGVLQGGGDVDVAATGAVNNQGGQILAGGALSLSSAGPIDNRSDGATRATIASGDTLTLTSQGLNNQGSDIKSAASARIDADSQRTGTGAIDNSRTALIATGGVLDLQGGQLDNRQTHGVGQGIQARSVSLNVQGLDNRAGALLAQERLAITAGGRIDNAGGMLSSMGALSIEDPRAATQPAASTLVIDNGAGGVIAANGATVLRANSLSNGGTIANAGGPTPADRALTIELAGSLNNQAGAYVQAAGDLSATAGGVMTNGGTMEAVNVMSLSAAAIDNPATGALRAGLIDLQADRIGNRGLINGGLTLLQAGTVDNAGAGRIYGDHIAVAAGSLTNRGGGGTDPVIASRGDLDLAVGSATNRDGALLLAVGDMRVGGQLDRNAHATGTAGAFVNSSAEVDVFGDLTIRAGSVSNVDGHGTTYNRTRVEDVVEYRVDDVHPTRNPADTRDNPWYNVPLNATSGQMDWRWDNDNQKYAYFVPSDGSEQIRGEWWWIDRYTRTTTESGTFGSDPARLSVGGNMSVVAGSTVNDKSSILVGGNLSISGGSLQNISGYRSREVTEVGTSQLSYTEERWYDWERHHRRFMDEPVERVFYQQPQYEDLPARVAYSTHPNHGGRRAGGAQAVSVASLSSAPGASTTATATTAGPVLGRSGPGVVVRTLPSGVRSGASVDGSGATAASSVNAPRIALPSNALFQLRIGAPAGYLVETDPEFTQQRLWLGSDHMLKALSYDPATQTQRLGDGFYEQRLVREQVAQLTGRRFLGSFTDDEAQYRALLDAGAAFAQAYPLKPGIALTREQMALLTSDIVWLVERSVTLPDGRTQRVLVPQLYALVDKREGHLQPGLISAQGMNITLSGNAFNSGTLAAQRNLSVSAAGITHLLGSLQGQNIDLRAGGSITSILGDIAARRNLRMKAGGDMVFIGGGISAGGSARLSAGGDLLLLAYDTGRQIRAQSPRDENGNPIGRGPVWSYENSTYNQRGVDIHVGGSFSARAGGNLVAQGVNARVGGGTSLSAGKDMQLSTALQGHVNTFNFYNKYKTAGDSLKITERVERRDIDLKNSGNTWASGGGMNLSAGGNMSLVGAQIDSQGFSARAGGNYEERAAYDVKEQVNNQSTKLSGIGVYGLDALNNTTWLATGGQAGGRTETFRATQDIDATRTAIVTNIDAGGGTVSRNVGGNALIEGSVIRGGTGQVKPLEAGGTVTQVAAVDSRHIEHSVSTSTIRWQSTRSTGSIEQTLHMPEIHGLPEGVSAYQGAGGVSVQLPAGSSVRTAIERLSGEPGKGYLKELGNRSDIDWQRVQALSQSLDFSKSGLTQEATIAVIIVVSILTYGAASSAGASAAAGANMTTAAGTAGATTATTLGGSTVTLTAGGAVVASAVTAGLTSLASTAAVSLINNKGDIGATLKELGSKENAQGLLLTMATAGLTQGLLDKVGLAGVDATSRVEQLLARNAVQGITSAVLESAVLGTDLEEALKDNLKGALINTAAAKGAHAIGDAQLDATSSAIAHALLGCAVGTATAGSSSGCAPGAAGAAIGEIVAGLYGDSQNLGGLEEQLKVDPNNAALKQQIAQIRHTVTELAKLTGAGGALLIGGDASDMQTAMGTASNAAVNNYLNHTELKLRDQAQRACNAGNQSACQTVRSLDQLSAERNATIRGGVKTATEAQAGEILQSMQTTMQGLSDYRGQLQSQLNSTTDPVQRASLQNQINQVDNHMKQVAALGKDYLAQQYQNTGNSLYQSAFAQLSAATNGNDLADAMASVMGVQLARLPTRPANTSESAATAAAQSSIDLAAIQRAQVENNATADWGAAVVGGVAVTTKPLTLPAPKVGEVVPNAMSAAETAQAADIVSFKGGTFVGQPTANTPGIDGWLNGVPVSLKEVTGGNGMLTVQKNITQGTSQMVKAGQVGDMYIDATKTGISVQDVTNWVKPGTPISNILSEGTVNNINIKTINGWVTLTRSTLTTPGIP